MNKRWMYILLGLFMIALAVTAGNTGSLVIGLLIAAVSLYVGLGGKLHAKFTRKPAFGGKTYEDDQMMELAEKLKGKFSAKKAELPER